MNRVVEPKRGRRGIRLFRWAPWTVAGVLGALVAVKYLIAPAVVESSLRSHLAESWDGPVAVERTEFNFFSPTILKGLSLNDHAGRQWCRAETVAIRLGWRPTPELAEASVDTVTTRIHVTDNRSDVPLRSIPDIVAGVIVIREARMEWVQDGLSRSILPGASVRIEKRNGMDNFSVTVASEGHRPAMHVAGKVERIDRHNLKIREVSIAAGNETVLDAVESRMHVTRTACAIEPFRLRVGDGWVSGEFQSECPASGELTYRGRLEAENVEIARAWNLLPTNDPVPDGVLSGRAEFEGEGWDYRGLNGHGRFHLQDANIAAAGQTAPRVLRAFGLSGGRDDSSWNARGRFRLRKGVVEFEAGRVENERVAFTIEAGSRLDPWAGDVDMTVGLDAPDDPRGTTAPTSRSDGGWLTRALRRLSRARIQCRWGDPETLRVTWAPPGRTPTPAAATSSAPAAPPSRSTRSAPQTPAR